MHMVLRQRQMQSPFTALFSLPTTGFKSIMRVRYYRYCLHRASAEDISASEQRRMERSLKRSSSNYHQI